MMVSFKDRLSGLRSKSTTKIGEGGSGLKNPKAPERRAFPAHTSNPTSKYGVIQMTLEKSPVSHLDRFQFTLNDRASASAAKV